MKTKTHQIKYNGEQIRKWTLEEMWAYKEKCLNNKLFIKSEVKKWEITENYYNT